jgi:uncharacterized protein involved in exopolysaccharide biosynthesis
MSEKVGLHNEAIRVLLEQYKENLRQLFREGKLSHQQLESQLSHVVDSVNEEIRKITAEVITEEDGVKKTAGAPCADERQKSTKKRRH